MRAADAPSRYVALGDSFTAGRDAPGFADALAELLRRSNPAP